MTGDLCAPRDTIDDVRRRVAAMPGERLVLTPSRRDRARATPATEPTSALTLWTDARQ